MALRASAARPGAGAQLRCGRAPSAHQAHGPAMRVCSWAPKSDELMPSTSTVFSFPNSARGGVAREAVEAAAAEGHGFGAAGSEACRSLTVHGRDLGGDAARLSQEDGQLGVGVLDLAVVLDPEVAAHTHARAHTPHMFARDATAGGLGTRGGRGRPVGPGAGGEPLPHRMPLEPGLVWHMWTRSSMSARPRAHTAAIARGTHATPPNLVAHASQPWRP